MNNLAMWQTAIREEEIYFPKRFASYTEKEYGILYYMDENPASYDGNHVCLFPEKIADLGAVLEDITAFYHHRPVRMQPLLYHPFQKGYFREKEVELRAHGYTYTPEDDHRVMLLVDENQIRTEKRLDIRVLTGWDERVAEDILLPSGEPWEVDVTRNRAEKENAYLFVGYLDGKAVCYTDIHWSDASEFRTTRFDYIVTAKAHRGNGYASELLCYVVEYCKKHAFPLCWEWAGPSENICRQAGFREMFSIEAGYAAGPK